MPNKADQKFFLSVFKEANDELAADSVSIRSYSGRSMYGRNCIAIVGEHTDCMRTIAQMVNNQIDKLHDQACDLCDAADEEQVDAVRTLKDNIQSFVSNVMNSKSDSMGLQVVYYWPDIAFTEEDENKFHDGE